MDFPACLFSENAVAWEAKKHLLSVTKTGAWRVARLWKRSVTIFLFLILPLIRITENNEKNIVPNQALLTVL